jgi:hypothetical protein
MGKVSRGSGTITGWSSRVLRDEEYEISAKDATRLVEIFPGATQEWILYGKGDDPVPVEPSGAAVQPGDPREGYRQVVLTQLAEGGMKDTPEYRELVIYPLRPEDPGMVEWWWGIVHQLRATRVENLRKLSDETFETDKEPTSQSVIKPAQKKRTK